jgi:hypothetical protein
VNDSTQRPPLRRSAGPALAATLLAGALALIFQIGSAAASRQAAEARRHLGREEPLQADQTARRALRFDPWQTQAAYTRLIALKRLGRWRELADLGEAVRPWHRQSPAVLQLLGEAYWQLGQPDKSAHALWDAFWRAPRPRESGAELWRLAATMGRRAWGASDPRVAAAALRAATLLETEERLTDEQRRAARRDLARILKEAGAPMTAEELQNSM